MQVPIEENQSKETKHILKSVIQKKFLKLKKKKKKIWNCLVKRYTVQYIQKYWPRTMTADRNASKINDF